MGNYHVTEEIIDLKIANAIAGGSGGTQSATVELTDAQIKAWADSNIELIPVPGSGKVNVVDKIVITGFQAVAYSGIDAAATIKFRYGATEIELFNTLNEASGTISNLLAGGGGSRPLFFSYPLNQGSTFSNIVLSLDDFENTNVNLVFDNQMAGALGGGDSSNTLKVTVYYTVVDL